MFLPVIKNPRHTQGRTTSVGVRLRFKSDHDKSATLVLSHDVLAAMGVSRGDSVMVFVGEGTDQGYVAVKKGDGMNTFHVSASGGSKSTGALSVRLAAFDCPPSFKAQTVVLPHRIEDGTLVVDVRPAIAAAKATALTLVAAE